MSEGRQRKGRRKPPPVSEVGTDPDPRFTLANERTLLAWNRTALALIAGGVAVHQLGVAGTRWLTVIASLLPICLGAAISVMSVWRWDRVERALRGEQPLPLIEARWMVGLVVVLLAIGACVLVIVDAAGS